MAFALTDTEHDAVRFVPVGDLVALAVELDYMPPETINRRELLGELMPRLLELARREGLPFSKYDEDDLAELSQEHREALAHVMGWPSDSRSMVKAGQKVYKVYRKDRRDSQVALLLPSLLKPLARAAFEG